MGGFSGSCPIAGFVITGIETSYVAAAVLAVLLLAR
jgi:hypothetical protein